MRLAYFQPDPGLYKRMPYLLKAMDVDLVLLSRPDLEAAGWLADRMPGMQVLDCAGRLDLGHTQAVLGPILEWNGEQILPYANTLCILESRSGKWRRIYMDLFPECGSDSILECSESINLELESLMGLEKNGIKS